MTPEPSIEELTQMAYELQLVPKNEVVCAQFLDVLRRQFNAAMHVRFGSIDKPESPSAYERGWNDALRYAQAPQHEAQSVRDAAPAIPDGWRFYSADFSVNAKDQRCPGHVMLIRDPDGKAAWLSLTDEEHEVIDLHVQGKGLTFDAALSDACEAALKSAPPQKPVSDEVKP